MISTKDFRTGLKIEIDGKPFEIVEFQHFKPGKGGAMVRTKLRQLKTGQILDIGAQGLDVYNTMLDAMRVSHRLGPSKRKTQPVDAIRV